MASEKRYNPRPRAPGPIGQSGGFGAVIGLQMLANESVRSGAADLAPGGELVRWVLGQN
jgi:hypothetical protein